MQFDPDAEGTRKMYGYPSQVRGSQATAKRRHNEILSGVQAERQAAQARASSGSTGSVLVTLRRRTGQLLIAAGQWLCGLAEPTAQTELKQRAAGRS